jgi:uncharacterized protein (TIGR02284 family)
MTKAAIALNELIEATRDGLDFYTQAIAHVRDPHVKPVFRAIVDSKHELILGLSAQVLERGAKPSREHTLSGTLHKLYADARASLSETKQAAYVAELEHSEDRLVCAFEDAAEKACDAQLRELILANLPRVRGCRDAMRDLRASLAA